MDAIEAYEAIIKFHFWIWDFSFFLIVREKFTIFSKKLLLCLYRIAIQKTSIFQEMFRNNFIQYCWRYLRWPYCNKLGEISSSLVLDILHLPNLRCLWHVKDILYEKNYVLPKANLSEGHPKPLKVLKHLRWRQPYRNF